MSKLNVYFDLNNSDHILVDGVGQFVSESKFNQLVKERDQLVAQVNTFKKLESIILAACLVVKHRGGDVITEDGVYATTDVNSLINLEFTIVDEFDFHSDSLIYHDIVPLIESLFKYSTPEQSLAEHDAEVAAKAEQDFIKAIFYAPSSPVSAKKAQEIEEWYGKVKQLSQQAKAGE